MMCKRTNKTVTEKGPIGKAMHHQLSPTIPYDPSIVRFSVIGGTLMINGKLILTKNASIVNSNNGV